MAFDYRAIEAKADALQREVLSINENNSGTPEDQARVVALMGEIKGLEDAAAAMRDAELEELRAIVANGREVAGGGSEGPSAEVEQFRAYLRTGEIRDASLSTTDANGGYVVPEPEHAPLIEKIRANDPVFGNATVFNMTGDTTLVLPYKATHGVVANATETGARAEQNAPTFTGPTLTAYDYYTDQRATQQFLDSVSGSESMLLGWIYEDIQEQAGVDAVAGDGTTKIKGIFAETATYSTEVSGVIDSLANSAFLKAYFALPVKFRRNGKWLMNGSTLAVAAAMDYPNASSVLPLAVQGANGEWTIFGKPVLESDSAPDIGNGAFPVAFADIAAAYAVGIHRNTSVLRDPYTATPYVRFYGLARMGGCAWDPQACVLLKSDDA